MADRWHPVDLHQLSAVACQTASVDHKPTLNLGSLPPSPHLTLCNSLHDLLALHPLFSDFRRA